MESYFKDIDLNSVKSKNNIEHSKENRVENFFKKLKKPFKIIRSIIVIIAVIIVLILLLELVSFCLIEGYRYIKPTDLMDLDVLNESDWVKDYIREERSLGNQYYPYLGWRRQKNFTEEYVNVDENSIRKTENPCESEDSLKIFVFGGSTIWGSGVRDSSTIPSYLSKYLCSKNIPVKVTNLGEGGYVSTQGMIALELELRKENYPDIIVFYDGINDVYASYQINKAGSPQNVFDREADFNSRKKLNIKQNILNSNIMKLKNRFLGKPEPVIQISPDLEDETIKLYLNNLKIIKTLEKEYDFKGFYYWQPTLATKIPMSEDEQNKIPKEEIFDKLYLNVTSKMQGLAVNNQITDLSGIFNNMNKTIYFDTYHLFEEGNQIIAQRIGDDIINYVKSS
ncbi:MAG: SGNH/GDSL hydrolase family protein [archaeon]